MKHTYIAAVSIALASFIPAGAETIDGILASIERNNIELKARATDITAETYTLKSENRLEPTSVEYSPFFNKEVSGVASSELVVSQEFDFPTLYAARSKSAGLQERVLKSELSVARRDILLDAKQKCLQLVLLFRQRDILRERDSISNRLLDLYQRRYDSGDATVLELNKVKMESMEFQTSIAENQAAVARLLRELTALNGNIPFDFSDLDYPTIPASITSRESLAALVRKDPSVIAAGASVDAANQDVKTSRQGWLPKISLGYRRNTEMHEANNGFLVGLSLPLFSTSDKVKAASSRLQASRLYMDNAIAAAENAIAADVDEIISTEKMISLYDLDLISETLDLLRKSVELGNMSVVDYYTETDKIYLKLQDYLTLTNRYHTIMANLLRNEL